MSLYHAQALLMALTAGGSNTNPTPTPVGIYGVVPSTEPTESTTRPDTRRLQPETFRAIFRLEFNHGPPNHGPPNRKQRRAIERAKRRRGEQ